VLTAYNIAYVLRPAPEPAAPLRLACRAARGEGGRPWPVPARRLRGVAGFADRWLRSIASKTTRRKIASRSAAIRELIVADDGVAVRPRFAHAAESGEEYSCSSPVERAAARLEARAFFERPAACD